MAAVLRMLDAEGGSLRREATPSASLGWNDRLILGRIVDAGGGSYLGAQDPAAPITRLLRARLIRRATGGQTPGYVATEAGVALWQAIRFQE